MDWSVTVRTYFSAYRQLIDTHSNYWPTTNKETNLQRRSSRKALLQNPLKSIQRKRRTEQIKKAEEVRSFPEGKIKTESLSSGRLLFCISVPFLHCLLSKIQRGTWDCTQVCVVSYWLLCLLWPAQVGKILTGSTTGMSPMVISIPLGWNKGYVYHFSLSLSQTHKQALFLFVQFLCSEQFCSWWKIAMAGC